jgi:hypothetical protein
MLAAILLAAEGNEGELLRNECLKLGATIS